MHSSDVLKVLSDADSLRLFKEIANRKSIDGESLMSISGLTKKQYYTRLQRQSQQVLILRRRGSFSLTSFGKVVYDYHLKLDDAIAQYYSLRAVDAFKDSKDLDGVQRKELIEKIISDGRLQSILLK